MAYYRQLERSGLGQVPPPYIEPGHVASPTHETIGQDISLAVGLLPLAIPALIVMYLLFRKKR